MKRNIYIIWLLIGLMGWSCGGVTETGNPESVEPGDEPVPGGGGVPSSLICEILEEIRESFPPVSGSEPSRKVTRFHPTGDTTVETIRKVSISIHPCDPNEEVESNIEIPEFQIGEVSQEIVNREDLPNNLEFFIAVYLSNPTLESVTEEKMIYALDEVGEIFSALNREAKATWALAVLSAELTSRYPEIFEGIENADREQILQFFEDL